MEKQKDFHLKIVISNELKFSSEESQTLVVFAGQKDISAKNAKLKGTSKEKKGTDTKIEIKNESKISIQTNSNVDASLIQKFIDAKSFSARSAETLLIRNFDGEMNNLVLFGIGSLKKVDHETIRRAGGSLHTFLKRHELQSVVVDFSSITNFYKDEMIASRALTEGLVLGSYIYTELKTEMQKREFAQSRSPKKISYLIEPRNDERAIRAGAHLGHTVADCTNFARRLGDAPANILTPTRMAQLTQEAARGTGIKVTVWDKARIKREKMGCFLGVSRGSSEEPRLIIMEYRGGKASQKSLCYVGKGLTFDSGGISIKPSAGMEEMKYDMCGGAAVIGAMLGIARLKLKVNVLAIVAATENMPGPAATKPGDVHTARNGRTVEVNNTDAEGRLVLADALVYASEHKPEFIVDAATLTGAMKMALGDTHTGYFCRDTELGRKIRKAQESSGESLWEMPVTEDHLRDMKGTYADLSNISSIGGAGSAKGAAFLGEFVEKTIPWAHFDIAGTAWHIGHRVPYCPDKGASGIMVRTFIELARLHK